MANLYVVLVAIRHIVIFASGAAEAGSFTMFTIISLLYPLLVLLFVNIVFHDVWKPRKLDPQEQSPSATRSPPGNLILICFNSIRQILRSSSGIMLCLAVMITGLFVAQLVLFPVELLKGNPLLGGSAATENQRISQFERFAVPVVGRILSQVTGEQKLARDSFSLGSSTGQNTPGGKTPGDETQRREHYTPVQWARFLLREKPGVLSLLFLLLCLILPSIIVFSGFNQISEDSRNKGLRYLLMRTRRRDIFFGKYLASVLLTWILLILLFLCILLYIHLKLDLYPFDLLLGWSLRGLLGFALISLPAVAIALGFSGAIDSGVGSLGATLGTLIILPLVLVALQTVWEPLTSLHYILPYKLSFYLFHPQNIYISATALAMAGYTAGYLAIGYLVFKKRDL
jgi:ABC-type transport system involved in multi-copper enzyme maturation permease subunit